MVPGALRFWNGPRMALNKTESEKFSWGFATNPTESAYNSLRSPVLMTILSKPWSCYTNSKVLQLQIVPILGIEKKSNS